jgi:cellulose synthase/poly-beta-1,6-N-acetylglucosamine synthase-like glycosyltransferase
MDHWSSCAIKEFLSLSKVYKMDIILPHHTRELIWTSSIKASFLSICLILTSMTNIMLDHLNSVLPKSIILVSQIA